MSTVGCRNVECSKSFVPVRDDDGQLPVYCPTCETHRQKIYDPAPLHIATEDEWHDVRLGCEYQLAMRDLPRAKRLRFTQWLVMNALVVDVEGKYLIGKDGNAIHGPTLNRWFDTFSGIEKQQRIKRGVVN